MWEVFCLMQLAYLLEFSFLFCSSDLKWAHCPRGMEVWKHTGRSTMHRTKEYEATYGSSQKQQKLEPYGSLRYSPNPIDQAGPAILARILAVAHSLTPPDSADAVGCPLGSRPSREAWA
jgi:hypothetical protein